MSYSYAMKAWGGEPGLVVNDVPVAPKPAAASGGSGQAESGESQGAMEHRDYVSSPGLSEPA